MIYNDRVLGVQQSDACIYICVCIYIHTHTLFQTLFHYRLLQDIKYSSLYYTVNTCLSFTYRDVYLLIPYH